MGSMRTKLRMWKFGRSTRGSAAAEFALCIPLLVIIMVAIIEMGRGMHDFHVVNQTVRDAARYLGRSPIDCTGASEGCQTCTGSGDCGPCDFVAEAGVTATQRIDNALAIAMTGDLHGAPGAENLLGYWQYPGDAASTITVQICRIDNEGLGFNGFDLTGIYSDNDGVPDTIVPHVRLTADVPFTFMFGELIAPTPTLEFTLAHNVVITGR